MMPLIVARRGFARWIEWIGAPLFEPFVDVVIVELLAPLHSGQSLTHHIRLTGAEGFGHKGGVKLVRLAATRVQYCIEGFKRIASLASRLGPIGGRNIRQT